MPVSGPKEKLLAALAKAYKDDHSRHAFEVMDTMRANVTDKSTIEDVSELFQKIATKDAAYAKSLGDEIAVKRNASHQAEENSKKHYDEAWNSAKHFHVIDAIHKVNKAQSDKSNSDQQSANAWGEALYAIPAAVQVEFDKSEASQLIALSQKAGFKHKGR